MSHKFFIASMLCEGAKLRYFDDVFEDRLSIFHKGIVPLVFCILFLAGCGHKTPPVYTPSSKAKTIVDDSTKDLSEKI